MRRKVFLFVLLTTLGSGWAAAHATDDARALAVVDEMVTAMGGESGWQQARFFRFDWVVEREGKTVVEARHLWDRYEGRYRVEWNSREGKSMAALFNVNTRTGHVFLNGEPARAEDEQKYLDQAYRRFINDSYWLLMPWKLKDPGVKLKYEGQKTLNGQRYDVLHVSFDSVGLTPGDHYWAYINRRTHLMERWAYFLQGYDGTPALDKATAWQWKEWEQVGGLRLAREKSRVGEDVGIHFPVLLVLDNVDPGVFESLDVPLPRSAPTGE